MAKSACRCKKAHECEECPEWIFTFADLVMLMMGFFVILWVLKPPAGQQGTPADPEWTKIAAAIRDAFDYIPDPTSKDPVDIEMIKQKLMKIKLSGPHDGGKTEHEIKSPQGTDQQVTNIRPSKHSTEGGKMLFEPGSATLRDETKKALDEIAEEVRGHRNIVMIKGHTALDDFPGTGTAQQKMDLSIRRAQAASDYLTERGVEPRILRVQGCSTFEPITQREYTPDSQDENRRIEVEATATLVDDVQSNAATRSANDVPPDGAGK